MSNQHVYIVSAVRTAIGTYGGSLRNTPLATLATHSVSGALQRAGLSPEAVEHVVLGNVIPTLPCDAYLSRVASVDSGIPIETPAFNVNRLCGSGLQAIISASQSILLGDISVAVAGGAESMSNGPYITPGMRWGARLGDAAALDYMNGILHDPWEKTHMGITAENVASKYGISRTMQDELAVESQRRAARAISKGYFKDQILPLEIRSKKETSVFDRDEHVRASATMDQLQSMKPVFKTDGTVTAGNASGLNDGASALVLANEQAVKQHGLTPLARLVGYSHSGVDPKLMGIGPVPAVQKVLKQCGLSLEQIGVIEANEAFAAQACAVYRELGLDPSIVNPNGSGISLGHPVGATGAIITTKLIHEMARTESRFGLATMCIGGGQGIAAIFERV